MNTEKISTWQIALGVFAGTLASSLCLQAIDAFLAQQAINRAQHELHETEKQVDKAAQEAARARNMQAATDFAERQRQEALQRDQQAASAAAANDAAVAKTAKEQAWQRYYQRPKECDNPPNDQAMVDCGNRAIRARTEFDRLHGS